MASVFKSLSGALPVAFLLSACNGVELPAPESTPSKIVLLGELIAGDSLHIRSGHSQPLTSTSYTVPEFEHDMQISCTSGGSSQALTGYEDDLLYSVYTTLFSHPETVRAQTEYRIKATKPGLQPVEALVKIPAAFNGSVTPAGPVIRNGDSMLAFDLKLGGMAAESRFVIEVLRSPVMVYTTFVYDGNGYELEPNRALYDSLIRIGAQVDMFSDTSYSPITERQAFYADRSSAENTTEGSNRSYYWFFLKPESQPAANIRVFISIGALRRTPGTYSELIIRLKSVASDYYEFLKVYELDKLQQTGQNMSFKPTTATGNVKGGLGVVGGVYQVESRYFF